MFFPFFGFMYAIEKDIRRTYIIDLVSSKNEMTGGLNFITLFCFAIISNNQAITQK